MIRLGLLWVFVSTAAAAHTGIPQSLSVTLRPGSDNDVLVSTTFGPVITHDSGGSWRVICEEAIGYGTGQRPAWWISPSGAMFAGSFKGLFVARGDGCTWQSISDFESTGCSDIQANGNALLATSGKYGVENRILRSTDQGLTWTASAEKSSKLFYSSLRIAPSNALRVYVAAWWFEPSTSILLRSDDNGQTFTRRDLSAALPAAGAFYVLAVHPLKPEVVFASVIRDTEPRTAWLLKSTDSGDTFVPVVTTPEIFGSVAFGADPSVVYGAAGNALYMSSDEGRSFTQLLAPRRNACVAAVGNRVFSCGLQELDGWAVGEGQSGDFGPLLKWSAISGPISCPTGSAVQMLCEPLWPVVKASFPAEADAGAAQSDGGPTRPVGGKGCGCGTANGLGWLASLVMLRRRALGAPKPHLDAGS